MAVCWLFPGKTVKIDSVCLDCGEPVCVEVKDGKIVSEDPKGLIGHVSVPFGRWIFNIPYS
ncbi:MAG: alkylmercury lyase family protein [Proteobacteria bacterium]|nr:alkylmercury lyase family protein [Pseudomonadota bacterium]